MEEDHLKRWKALVERAQEALRREGDAGGGEELTSLLDRLNGVQGAIQKISQGAISSQKLSEAVEESLSRILEDHPERRFPQLKALASRLEESEGRLQKRMQGLEASRVDPDLLLSRAEAMVQTRTEGLAERLEDRLDAIQAMVGSLPRVLPLGGRFDRLFARVEELESTLRGDLQGRLEGLESLHRNLADEALSHQSHLSEQLQARFDALEESLAEQAGLSRAWEERLEDLRREIAQQAEGLRSLEEGLQGLMTILADRRPERERVLRHLALDLRDILTRNSAESARTEEARARGSWFKRARPTAVTRPVDEEREYRLQCLLEQLESFLTEPPEPGS